MAMTIKDKNEVGAYIDFLLKEHQWKQEDLSKKLTELERRPVSREMYANGLRVSVIQGLTIFIIWHKFLRLV